MKHSFKIFITILLSAFSILNAATVKEVTNNNSKNLILENDFLTVTIQPEKGGRITSVIYKNKTAEAVNFSQGKGGLLIDAENGLPLEWNYEAKILKDSGNEAKVELTYETLNGLRYTKTVSLAENELLFKVTLGCENVGYTTQETTWEIHNSLNSNGGKFVIPENGAPKMLDKSYSALNLSSGFFAALDPDNTQFGIMFNYDQTGRVSVSVSNNIINLITCSSPFKLEPNTLYRTTMSFCRFSQMENFQTINNGGVFRAMVKNNILSVDGFGLVDDYSKISAKVYDRNDKVIFDDYMSLKLFCATISAVEFNEIKNLQNCKKIELTVSGRSFESSWTIQADNSNAFNLPPPPKNPPQIIKKNTTKLNLSEGLIQGEASENTVIKVLQLLESEPKNLRKAVFRNSNGVEKYLKASPRFEIRTVSEKNFAAAMKELYSYNVLIINDFPANLIEPYYEDLKNYAAKGNGILIFGGENIFGENTNYQNISDLLPVNLSQASAVIQPCSTLSYNGNFDFTANCSTINLPDAAHPAVSGIAFDSIAPSFYPATLKNAAKMPAMIDNKPFIATLDYHDGRLTACMAADWEKLYFWSYTPRFIEQLIEWTAKMEDQVWMSYFKEKDTITVNVHNNSKRTVVDNFEISEIAPDNTISMLAKKAVSLYEFEHQSIRIDYKKLAKLPGEHLIIAKIDGKTMSALINLPQLPGADKIQIDFKNHHYFVRGEMVKPEITINQMPDNTQFTAKLVDSSGNTVATGKNGNHAFDSSKLAFGSYRYTVQTSNGFNGKMIFITDGKKSAATVGYHGMIQTDDDFIKLAVYDFIAGNGNAVLSETPDVKFNNYLTKLKLTPIISDRKTMTVKDFGDALWNVRSQKAKLHVNNWSKFKNFFSFSRTKHLGNWMALDISNAAPETVRAQLFLALTSGADGYFWYSLNSGFHPDIFESVAPYDRLAVKLSNLLAVNQMRNSNLAVLVLGDFNSGGPEVKALLNLLYENDFDFEVISANDADLLDNYDTLIVAANQGELTSELQNRLEKFARFNDVLLTSDCKFTLKGGEIFSLDKLDEDDKSRIITPSPEIYADYLFRSDAISYFLVFNKSNMAKKQIIIELPENGDAKTACDLLSQKRTVLDTSDQNNPKLEISLEPFEGKIFAVLNDEPSSPKFVFEHKSFRRGEVVKCEVDFNFHGLIPVQIEIFDPAGNPTDYSFNADVEDGKYSIAIQTGINDKIGAWTIKVHEIISGKSGKSNFNLR